jgi:hypothetical protein
MDAFRISDVLERRRAARRAPNASVCCAIRDPRTGHSWSAAIRDISLTGIMLLAEQQFEDGQLLTIELLNTKTGFTRKYLVEVCHADICCPNDAYLHGCRFARPLRDEDLRMWI